MKSGLTMYISPATARVHACLAAHLPAILLAHLPSYDPAAPETATALLDTLSHGQLLCMAYNAVLRKSQRPWGFIPSSSIHDIIALQSGRSSQAQAQAQAEAQGKAQQHGAAEAGASGASSSMLRRVSSEGASTSASDDDAAGVDRRRPASQAGAPARKVGFTFRRLENLRLFVAAVKLRYGVNIDVDVKRIVQRDARDEEGTGVTPAWKAAMREVAVRWVRAAAAEKMEEEPDTD